MSDEIMTNNRYLVHGRPISHGVPRTPLLKWPRPTRLGDRSGDSQSQQLGEGQLSICLRHRVILFVHLTSCDWRHNKDVTIRKLNHDIMWAREEWHHLSWNVIVQKILSSYYLQLQHVIKNVVVQDLTSQFVKSRAFL